MSKSGKDRNYNLADANAAFKNITGRDLNQSEITWLQQGRGDLATTGSDVAATAYANGLQGLSKRILSNATDVLGMKNFTIEDANKLRDSLYVAGDANSANTFDQRANSALQRMYVDQKTNPTVTPQQQADHQSSVDYLFQSTLGRTPSQIESDYFAKQIAQGVSPYELQNLLQNTPEYQKIQADAQQKQLQAQAQAAQDALGQSLQQQTQQAFNLAAPNIIGSYMRSGRLNSSGLNSAMAQAMQQLQSQAQGFLGQVGYQQAVAQQGYNQQNFLNQQNQAFQNYLRQSQPTTNNQLALGQAQLGVPTSNINALTETQNQLNAYNMQQNSFNNYLQMQRSMANQAARYGLYGSLLGAGGSAASGMLSNPALLV